MPTAGKSTRGWRGRGRAGLTAEMVNCSARLPICPACPLLQTSFKTSPVRQSLLANSSFPTLAPEHCPQYGARATLTQLTQQPPPDVLAATQAEGGGEAMQAEIWQVGWGTGSPPCWQYSRCRESLGGLGGQQPHLDRCRHSMKRGMGPPMSQRQAAGNELPARSCRCVLPTSAPVRGSMGVRCRRPPRPSLTWSSSCGRGRRCWSARRRQSGRPALPRRTSGEGRRVA